MTKKTTENVVGLDLASKLGVSVFDGVSERLLYSESVPLCFKDPQKRLLLLREFLEKLFNRFLPKEVAIEDVFLPAKTSRRTPIALGELRGIARLCAAERGIPVFFYPPRRVKLAITGYGNAAKKDVITCVQNEFAIKVKDDNEADAISIAWCHLMLRRFSSECQGQ